jgi:ABC-type transport system involved in multi-copper enzyme maturation permease subunit
VIELVLAQPVSRVHYLTAHLLFALSSMVLVALAGLAGAIIGQNLFGLEPFAWDRLMRLLGDLVLLQMSFYSLTLLFSSFGREAGRVATLAVFIAIVSFLVNVIATLWNKAAFIKPYSLHTYYDPRSVLVDGHLATQSVLVLGVFTCLALVGAFARFITRDLP